MTEYRVMYNAYNGKGDKEYIITDSAIKAVEAKLFISDTLCREKGVVWLETREVTSWRSAQIKD